MLHLLPVIKEKLNNEFMASHICDALGFPISDTSVSCPCSLSSPSFVSDSSARISATIILSVKISWVAAT